MFKCVPVRQSISHKDLRMLRALKWNASPNRKSREVQNTNVLLHLQLKFSCIVVIWIWNRTLQLKFVNQWTILHIKVENLHNRRYHEIKLERELYCGTDWYSFDNDYVFWLWIPTLHLSLLNILDLKRQIFVWVNLSKCYGKVVLHYLTKCFGRV